MESTLIAQVISGMLHALTPFNTLLMVVGLVIGIIGGMLPGITTVTAIALFVPFTFSMPPASALIALGAVYCGAMYGGANAAILINTPGQPGSIATVLDGYPMTCAGRAEEALYAALLASAFGGVVGSVMLLLFFEPLSGMALQFGSEAFFWMAIFGMTTLAAMSAGQVLKSLFGGALGLGLSTIGLDPSNGIPRFTFGSFDLVQGLDMVVLMTSLFSFSQMLYLLESRDAYIAKFSRQPHAFLIAVKALLCRSPLLVSLSSVVGTFIGSLPGAGGSVAAIITYNEAKRWDKHPERYGTGVIEGVLVPESANNASVGGSLVPLMALGIPGSAAAAVLMGGLLAQGLTPGPQLMETNPDIAYTFIASLIIVNLVMVPVGWVLALICSRILDVPKRYIIPSVITLSFIGAYSLRNSLFDVLVMLLAGGASYLLLKARIQPAAIALGVVLGPIIEESCVTTLLRARSDDSILDLMVFSPFSLTFIALSVLALTIPLLMNRQKGVATMRWQPSFSGLADYDAWVVAAATAASALYWYESSLLAGTTRLFPFYVFAIMTVLGVLILASKVLTGESAPTGTRFSDYKDVLVYFFMASGCYFCIGLLGFYAALWLCMLGMLFYGALVDGPRPLKARVVVRLMLVAATVVFVQYACFSLLLNVPTPEGLFM